MPNLRIGVGLNGNNTKGGSVPAPLAPSLTGVFNILDSVEGTVYNYDLNSLNTGGSAARDGTGWTFNGVKPSWATITNAGYLVGTSIVGSWSGYSVTAHNSTGSSSASNTDSVIISEASAGQFLESSDGYFLESSDGYFLESTE